MVIARPIVLGREFRPAIYLGQLPPTGVNLDVQSAFYTAVALGAGAGLAYLLERLVLLRTRNDMPSFRLARQRRTSGDATLIPKDFRIKLNRSVRVKAIQSGLSRSVTGWYGKDVPKRHLVPAISMW